MEWSAVAAKLCHLASAFMEQWLDLVAHGIVFVMLQTWNTTLLAAEALGFCLFYYFFPELQNVGLNWQYVSFAVVFPVVFFVRETWRRREEALKSLAIIKSVALAIYLCNRDWVRPAKLDPAHPVRAQRCICNLLRTLRDYLLMPRLTTRDLYFDLLREGRYEKHLEERSKFRRRILALTAGLSRLAADLRDYGMPPPELIRLASFHRKLSLTVEGVLTIKDYRTPQGPRSIARIDVLLMFAVFGVYFAWAGEQVGSPAFGAVLAVGCAQVLGTVVQIGAQLEDPFNAGTSRDQINVVRDVNEVIRAIENDGEEDAAVHIDTGLVEELFETTISRDISGTHLMLPK